MPVRKRGSRRQIKADAASADVGSNAASKMPSTAVSHDEVLAAIESLYLDELKPFGRILRKRVAERAMSPCSLPVTEDQLPAVDVRSLKSTCEKSDKIRVDLEEGGDWSAVLVDHPQSFVNVYSPYDNYPADMWNAFAAYFDGLVNQDAQDLLQLPGGRYSCAQTLQARSLPFLDGRSLGQLCHIVQLAMSQKKILGYLNGMVVPYASSQCAMKEQCAFQAKPCNANQAGAMPSSGLPMATWDEARTCLKDILDASTQGDPSERIAPLSNVKRLFRSKYNLELSETTLGHSKLSDLLQDPRFADICTVRLQDHGYIVVQVKAPAVSCSPPPVREVSSVTIDAEPRRIHLAGDGSLEDQSRPDLTLWLPRHGFENLVQRTFIHASVPPPTPPPHARPRSKSLPQIDNEIAPLKLDQVDLTESTIDSEQGSSRWNDPASDDQYESHLQSEADQFKIGDMVEIGAGEPTDFVEDKEPRQRCLFCPDEPLAIEEADSLQFHSVGFWLVLSFTFLALQRWMRW
jgi:hypothetical protein